MPRNTKPEDGLAFGLFAILALAFTLTFIGGCGVGKATAHPMTQTRPICPELQACRDDLARAKHDIAWQKSARKHAAARALNRAIKHQPRTGTAAHAIALAAFIYGVSESALSSVAWCESRHTPTARNSAGYSGLFQLGGHHLRDPIVRRFGWADVYANAMHTARYVSLHGWGEWQCVPGGGLRW